MSNVPKMIRILAVDDHALLRKGLAAVINAEPALKLEVAAELAGHATDDELSEHEIEVLRLIAAGNSNKQPGNNSPGTVRMLFPGRASTVGEAGALSDLDNISVRIADVAARLAVLGDRLRDELRSSTFP
jgi:hypothetical protein